VTNEQASTELARLLGDPIFASLLDEAMRDYLDWEQLIQRPLPAGISAAETWNLLTTLRRQGATYFPVEACDGTRYWYRLTQAAMRCLQTVDHHCRSDSSLHQAVLEREGQRYLVRSRIQEAIATCQLDGVEISYEAAGRLLHGGHAAQTAAEQFVINAYELLGEVEDLATETLSPDLAWRIYERVVERVELSELGRVPLRHNLTDIYDPNSCLVPEEQARVLQRLCDYANCLTGDPDEPIPLRGYAFQSAFGYWQPLPDFNGTVARLMLRLFAVQHDYPVLGYLPVSRMIQEWADGKVEPPVVRFQKLEAPRMIDGWADYSRDALTFLQLMVAAIEKLRDYIVDTRRRDEELQRVLDAEEGLNYRQRSVLSRALANPDAEFRIRHHHTTHRVVYATARADLLDLVDKGYLYQEMRGKAFVFVPQPGLRERIGGGS